MSNRELTVDFDEPYLDSGGLTIAAVPPWMIAIDGRRYLLDTKSDQYWRKGIEVLQQRNTTNQRDLMLLPQDVWRQQFESWHQGAGQLNIDRESALPYRYFHSYGINPWTQYEFKLLHETENIHPLTGHDFVFLHTHNGALVACTGTTLTFFVTDGSDPAPLTVGTAPIIFATYDGDAIITLHSDGKVFKTTDRLTTAEYTYTFPVMTKPADAPDDWTPPPDPDRTDATFIGYVKDYLIIGIGNQMYDITGPQARLVYTSPVTGFTWKGAAEGNNAIYAIGGAGDKNVIHRFGIRDDGTGLAPGIVAATLPDGEHGVAIGSYLGYVFIGTDKGFRMATPVGSADLVLGALIETHFPVYGFEGQDRFVWITGSRVKKNVETEETVCGLYRIDLSTFTVTESTPAWASDLVAEDQSGKIVRSVVTWNDKRVFVVEDGGIYAETTNLMREGWLVQGRVSFSVEDLKTALYLQAKWEPLRGTVAIDLAYDSGRPMRVLNWGIRDTIRSGNVPLNGKQFSRMDSRIYLYRDTRDATEGPVFTRFEVRARPVMGTAHRWSLPIINHEELDLNGLIEARDVTVEFRKLMDLVETGKMFALQEWGQSYQVVVKDYTWFPQKLDNAGAGWQGLFILIVEEVR